MITLHALTQSRAFRIAWLLELLDLEYQVNIVERDAQTKLAPATLKQLHPLGKSPLLQDGDRMLAESGAIVDYLIERHGQGKQLKPASSDPAWPDYLYWLHYAEGSLMPLMVTALLLRHVDQRKKPFFVQPIAKQVTDGVRKSYLHPQLALHLAHVEQSLQGKTWLLGGDHPTGADVMMSFPLQAALSRSGQKLPNIAAYVQRLEADPHYRQAEQKLGKLTLL